jgi:hypothetical protein
MALTVQFTADGNFIRDMGLQIQGDQCFHHRSRPPSRRGIGRLDAETQRHA